MNEIRPLTPDLRERINRGFEETIEELRTCEQNSLVRMEIDSLRTAKRMINNLPDGYPIPIHRE